MVARNQLSSLFLSEGRYLPPPCLFLVFKSADSYFLLCFWFIKENEDSPKKDSGSKSFGSPRYTKELKDEVCNLPNSVQLQVQCVLILMDAGVIMILV